jgi:CDP-paratose 2-epimerase
VVEKEKRWDWDATVERASLPIGFDPLEGISAQFNMDGPTKTIYGASKAAADFFCQEYSDAFNVPVIINRCGVIAGAGQFGVIHQGWLTFWAISCLFERPITYFGYKGKQVRDILFIKDLCSLVQIQLKSLRELSGQVWNVGGGRENSLSLIEATELMERLMNKKMATSHQEQTRKGDMIIYITDNSEITGDLAWSPTVSVEEGAEGVARWVRDNRTALAESGL